MFPPVPPLRHSNAITNESVVDFTGKVKENHLAEFLGIHYYGSVTRRVER